MACQSDVVEDPLEGAAASDCDDEQDNDADGLVDCEDDGCAHHAVCVLDTGSPHLRVNDVTELAVELEPEVLINEFLALNKVSHEVEDGPENFPDWIELYNTTGEDIDLGGYTISDNLEVCDHHIFPAGLVVPAGGWLLLYATGEASAGAQHLNFRLKVEGEELALCRPDGTPLTKIQFGQMVEDWSAARFPDASLDWDFDETPTPGEANEL